MDAEKLYKHILNVPVLKSRYSLLQLSIELLKGEQGSYVEFGVAQGNSLWYLSNSTENDVYGFDSFEGLPEAWDKGNGVIPEGTFKTDKAIVYKNNVKIVEGLFKNTVNNFFDTRDYVYPVLLAHIDCDLYSSTKDILNSSFISSLVPELSIIIFDELCSFDGNYPSWREGEWKALLECGWNEILKPIARTNTEQVAFRFKG